MAPNFAGDPYNSSAVNGIFSMHGKNLKLIASELVLVLSLLMNSTFGVSAFAESSEMKGYELQGMVGLPRKMHPM